MKQYATILMLTGMAIMALADNPEVDSTYFHPAASLYIHGDAAAASNLVERGLAEFPEDGKLKRLKELLDKQQQQKQNEQNQQNKDQQQDQQPDQQQQNQDQQDQQDQQQDQNQDQADQQDQQQTEPQRAEQMSQDEAERLLDAMKQEEKNKRLDLHPVIGRPVNVEKDW